MKCIMCGGKLIASQLALFHYTASGLSKVYLRRLQVLKCSSASCSEEEVVIPRMEELHQLLAERISRQPQVLLPEEIRFLRTHLGFSGLDFSRALGVSPETVSRWEKGVVNMKEASERLLRVLILSKSGPFLNYEELSEYASIETRTALKRFFVLNHSHWQEAKAS